MLPHGFQIRLTYWPKLSTYCFDTLNCCHLANVPIVYRKHRPSKWIFHRGLVLYTFVIIAIGSGHGGSSCCKCHLLWGEICWVIVPQIGRGLEPRAVAWARCEGCCCRRDRAVDGAHRRPKTKLWRGRKSGPEVERWRLLFAAAASVLTFTDFANLWRRNVWKGNFKCFV